MKLATNRYQVKITNTENGKTAFDGYYGYTSRKQAEARAALWNKIPNAKAEVIDTKRK